MLRFDAIPTAVSDLLLRLAPHVALRDFALGGGTSLALRFGHRRSVDLDFFTLTDFQPEDLFSELALHPATITARASHSLSIDVGGVKLDLLRHAYPLLRPVERHDEVTLISLPDIAAMKLNAIANRGSKKDFFDLAVLLDHFPLPEMIGYFTGKYASADPFTVIRSLAWFEDAESEPDPVALDGRTWAGVKDRARAAVAGL